METDEARVPLVLPTVDAEGHLNVPADAWVSVENLIGVLAASAPGGWPGDLVDLTGWSVLQPPRGPRLSLADLVADPVPTLRAWLGALATDADLLGTLTATVAHLTGGSTAGLAGVFSGSGTPQDPWLASLAGNAQAPALAVWLTPDGPVTAAALAGPALTRWRPGMPGLPPDGLAQALFDEARAGDDVAALAAGRSGIAAGLQALLGRWTGTDGMVAPPPDPVPGVIAVLRPELTWDRLAEVEPAEVIDGGLPAGAVVVRVAIATAPDSLPWTPADGRLIDLSPPGLAPESFTVAAPADGEWVVALAPRADAGLGGAADPSGVLGQAARLEKVLGQLAGAGPVVLVALGGAGHAARVAADAVSGVTHLITLGTPWSAATFDSARVGIPADAARLLRALLPPVDPLEPDDEDLAVGRALVTGFADAARGTPAVTDLEAPRPTTGVRAGLSAIAVFGTLSEAAVGRGMTAVFAAGLAARAQARADAAAVPPDAAHIGLRVPFALDTPPGGHGVTVDGAMLLELASIAAADAAVTAAPVVTLDLAVADTDTWLLGGPGHDAGRRRPAAGAAADHRRASGSACTAANPTPPSSWRRARRSAPTGSGSSYARRRRRAASSSSSRCSPRPRPRSSPSSTNLKAEVPSSPAGALVALLKASGVSQDDGALLPDGIAHLLHDPGAQVRAALATAAGRDALLAALHGLLAGAEPGRRTRFMRELGPMTLDADLAARTLGFTASGNEGVLTWHVGAAFDATGAPDASRSGSAIRRTTRSRCRCSRARCAPSCCGRARRPCHCGPRSTSTASAGAAAAALPAEALRILLEGLRSIDNQVGHGARRPRRRPGHARARRR